MPLRTLDQPADHREEQLKVFDEQLKVFDELDQIRCRAYEIYLERGGQNGYALDDWLAAEAEIHTAFSDPGSTTARLP